jgi:hypothetical protein
VSPQTFKGRRGDLLHDYENEQCAPQTSLQCRRDLAAPGETKFLQNHNIRSMSVIQPPPYTFPAFRHNTMHTAERRFNLWPKQTSNVVLKRDKTAGASTWVACSSQYRVFQAHQRPHRIRNIPTTQSVKCLLGHPPRVKEAASSSAALEHFYQLTRRHRQQFSPQ